MTDCLHFLTLAASAGPLRPHAHAYTRRSRLCQRTCFGRRAPGRGPPPVAVLTAAATTLKQDNNSPGTHDHGRKPAPVTRIISCVSEQGRMSARQRRERERTDERTLPGRREGELARARGRETLQAAWRAGTAGAMPRLNQRLAQDERAKRIRELKANYGAPELADLE